MMRSTDLGGEYEKLGHLMVAAAYTQAEGVFFHAELEPGVIFAALFEDTGHGLIYRHPTNELGDQVEHIWEQLDEDDRWQVILCTVRDGKFSASFVFHDDIDPSEHSDERRARILKELFGNKPIDYSDPEPGVERG
jgi:hypothetical protein